ncbi:MAG: SHOCT domain-containing protein [Candidatus Coproplasma sp.]
MKKFKQKNTFGRLFFIVLALISVLTLAIIKIIYLCNSVFWGDIVDLVVCVGLIGLDVWVLLTAPDGSCRKMAMITVLYCMVIALVNYTLFLSYDSVYGDAISVHYMLDAALAAFIICAVTVIAFFFANFFIPATVHKNEAGGNTGTVNQFLIKILPLVSALALLMYYFDGMLIGGLSPASTLVFGSYSKTIFGGWYIPVGIVNWIMLLGIIALSIVSVVAIKKHYYERVMGIGRRILIVFTAISVVLFAEGLIRSIVTGYSDGRLFSLDPLAMMIFTLVVHIVYGKKFANEELAEELVEEFVWQEENKKEKREKAPRSCYVKLVPHTICSLIVPFWLCFWVYRTTKYLKDKSSGYNRGALAATLLYTFIPFYGLYWAYVSAQAVDEISGRSGETSTLPIICLISSIYSGVLPSILIQDNINKLEQKVSDEHKEFTVGEEKSFDGSNMKGFRGEEEYAVTPSAALSFSVADEIKKFKELLDSGIITWDEFNEKKTQLLNIRIDQ